MKVHGAFGTKEWVLNHIGDPTIILRYIPSLRDIGVSGNPEGSHILLLWNEAPKDYPLLLWFW